MYVIIIEKLYENIYEKLNDFQGPADQNDSRHQHNNNNNSATTTERTVCSGVNSESVQFSGVKV